MSHPTQPSQFQQKSPYQQPSTGATTTATAPDPRAAHHAERERRRVESWRRRVERQPRFEKLRKPRATRTLIAIYLGGMAVAFAALPLSLSFTRDSGPDNLNFSLHCGLEISAPCYVGEFVFFQCVKAEIEPFNARFLQAVKIWKNK